MDPWDNLPFIFVQTEPLFAKSLKWTYILIGYLALTFHFHWVQHKKKKIVWFNHPFSLVPFR